MEGVLKWLMARTWPWMAVALLMVGGFMLWLWAATSDMDTSFRVDTEAASADVVADTAFANSPERFSRRRIVLVGVLVDQMLGRATLTLDLPGRPGYPAILDRTVVGEDLRVVAGDNLALGGWVYVLNDSILNVWAQRGLFDPENREALVGQETFFLVDSLDFVFPGQ